MKKRACVFSCLLCLMIFLNGCVRSGTKRELEALAVVMGIAMDKMDEKSGPESERLLLTAQVVRNIAISQNSSQSEGGGSASEGDLSKPYWNVQVTGTDLLEALRSAVHITNRRLYVAQNQILVIGRELAEDGIAKYLDYFFRDHETRYDVSLIVSEGTASEILNVESHLESFPAQDLNKLIARQQDDSHAPRCTLFSFFRDYKTPYKASLVPMVCVAAPEDTETQSPYLYVAKSAVFKEDKMVAELDERQTRGALWMLGEVQRGVITVNYEGVEVAIEILDGSGNYQVEYSDGRIKVKADIKMTGSLGELQGSRTVDASVMDALEKTCAGEIEAEIRSAFREMQLNGADVLGIGEAFYRYYPRTWKMIANHFESLYPAAELTCRIDADIIRTGSLLEPADENGREAYD